MIEPVELQIDVTDVAGIGQPAHTAATVFLPEPDALCDPPIVCFAFPGGGYSRGYYSFDMPDGSNGSGGTDGPDGTGSAGSATPAAGDIATNGGQARFHTERGWIFVACDSLGFGDATAPGDDSLTFENIALANQTTVAAVLDKLADATLREGYPAVRSATVLGIGQSMGGCFTIVLQAQHATFDGIAALGFSGIHTNVPSRPGVPAPAWPWLLRSSGLKQPKVLNQAAIAKAAGPTFGHTDDIDAAAAQVEPAEHPFAWAFHFDDEPADIVAMDLAPVVDGAPVPPWKSVPPVPPCGGFMVAPGAVATEAASITAPVLIAVGERDVVANPWLEPSAFKSSSDISVYVCERMAHMHNFASTRRRFWQRIHSWGEGVAALRSLAD